MNKKTQQTAAPLVTAFGGSQPNRLAIDVANNFNGSVCRNLIDKVSAALSAAHVRYVAPRLSQVFGWMRPPEPK